jgi:phosphatidylserine/phosphatidylglycerophosphate/cardiolipin synthase-like enzyme
MIKFISTILLGSVLFSSLSSAESLKYLANSEDSLFAFHQVISKATRSIDILTYEFGPCDDVTQVIVALLARQKKLNPSLRIRIIADDYPFNRYNKRPLSKKQLSDFLLQNKISFRVFNQKGLFGVLGNYSKRNHSKYIVVDSLALLTGSSNIADSYFGMNSKSEAGRTPVNYLNRDILVVGPAAQSAQKNFDVMWRASETASAGASLPKSCFNRTERQSALIDFLDAKAETGIKKVKSFSCSQVKFAADNLDFWYVPSPFDNADGLNKGFDEQRLQQISKKASLKEIVRALEPAQSIVAENYLYLPFLKLQEVMNPRQKRVELFTNYFRNTGEPFEAIHNSLAGREATRGLRLHSIGISGNRFLGWAFSVPEAKYQIHSKVFVAKSPGVETVIVSSFNIDPRSYSLNTESALVVRNCAGFAEHVEFYTRQLDEGQGASGSLGFEKRRKGYVESPVADPDQGLWNFLHFFNQL